MARVRSVIAEIAPHDSAERYRGLGADVIEGRARIVDPWTVEAAGRRMTRRRIVVATGAEPVLPPIPGLADVEPLTSETVWDLTERPARLLVVGGGRDRLRTRPELRAARQRRDGDRGRGARDPARGRGCVRRHARGA